VFAPGRALLRVADASVLASIRPRNRLESFAARAGSGAAQGGLLWAGCSAALAAAGGRYRRAAIDGAAGWAAAELVVGAAKPLIDRPRPRVPWRSGSSPSSSSMPSAHTAAGFAYATAAGLAAPVAALPLGALAAGVGWSRLSTGRHFPTDVAVAAATGIVVGAAVGWASHRLAPSDRAADASAGAPVS
jgi:membrane-associated phospholipid phosphatase